MAAIVVRTWPGSRAVELLDLVWPSVVAVVGALAAAVVAQRRQVGKIRDAWQASERKALEKQLKEAKAERDAAREDLKTRDAAAFARLARILDQMREAFDDRR